MKSIEINYFAQFRELANCSKENLEIDFATYEELYQYLNQKYNFAMPIEMIKLAVNDEFCSLQTKITQGAKIVFIPPVAGG